MKQLFHCLIIVYLCTHLLYGQSTTSRIHIDQFGYLPQAEKVAVISDPQLGFNAAESFIPADMLQIRNEQNGIVFEGSVARWNNGATHDQSGDKGWWFDFSSVSAPGIYHIYDPVNNVKSYDFRIDEGVYNEIMKAAGRMFYYNRCNAAKQAPYADDRWTDGMNLMNNRQDGNCRYVWDRNNASKEKDLSGGWFDAGDYNKYVTFASNVIHDLLNAYQENPQAFGDNWNIPESGNGLPDIIDEIKWELDWLIKMQNDDGGVIIKMGSIEHNHNSGSPPSINTDPRYYGPICSSSTIALVGMFAHASVVLQEFEELKTYAEELKSRASLSWAYVLPQLINGNLDEGCDDGTIKAGDADRSAADQKSEALIGAIYLYELTGDNQYNNYLSAHIMDAPVISGTWWGPYTNSLNEALLRYTTYHNASSSLKQMITGRPGNHVNQDWDGFYGFNDADLYRAFVPTWAYHWGSNNVKAQFANLNQIMVRYGIAVQPDDLKRKAAEQLHYFHGVNPLSMVQLSNMYDYGAENCANEIYHTWFNDNTVYDNSLESPVGPAPGYVVGGANKDFSIANISPPSGQPAQKSYLDWNTGWPENSWEITEPAIYYQSAYIRLLANFVQNTSTTSSINYENLTGISIFPNPTTEYIFIKGAPAHARVSIHNINGQVVYQAKITEKVDIQNLPKGTYLVKLSSGNQRSIHKILKM